jgi:hypothetical protein
MDLEKAKRFGELAKAIEELQVSLNVAKSGVENRAWITEIRATDEGECERSFKFPLPPHVQLVADRAYTQEALDAMEAKGQPLPTAYRPIREQAQLEGHMILTLIVNIIENKLVQKHKEMAEL